MWNQERINLFKNGWTQNNKNDFTVCGTGSLKIYTKIQLEQIDKFLQDNNIKTMNDIGCGDQNWITDSEYIKNNVDYLGYDFVDLDTRFQKKYNYMKSKKCSDEMIKKEMEKKEYFKKYFPIEDKAFNIVNELPRKCDVTLCHSVLQHLEEEEVLKALENMKKTSKYLMLDNCDNKNNKFKKTYTSDWKPWNFNIEPFNLQKYEIFKIKQFHKPSKIFHQTKFFTIYKLN